MDIESERESGENEEKRGEKKERGSGAEDALSLAPVDEPCRSDSTDNEHHQLLKLQCDGSNSIDSPSRELERLTSHGHGHGDSHHGIDDNGHVKKLSWMGRICEFRTKAVFVYESLFILSALAVYKFCTRDTELSWWRGVYTSAAVPSRRPPPIVVPCEVDWLAFHVHYPNPDPDYTWDHSTGLPSACSAESSARNDRMIVRRGPDSS
ncbi:hypothetical protein CBR_g19279 [Chara braunii]|uniref:Uncharacterized protein n=1 Tax=Chara braunii TaxID=69332 RepID=A0A388KXJ0_CHABU|nr:hypothetical protein CBR_g19279 [Chara braunii]|eukprot:GBG74767.1 hypothetical protein CBR_g19279 [Chara braunii]